MPCEAFYIELTRAFELAPKIHEKT
jgi:hypothetical protein